MAKWNPGDKLFFDMDDGVFIRATFIGDEEGWCKIQCDADESFATVRPSRLIARATGEAA
jgi:hypothetical protein